MMIGNKPAQPTRGGNYEDAARCSATMTDAQHGNEELSRFMNDGSAAHADMRSRELACA